MRTSGGAPVGVVTELVDVEGPLSVGVVARNVPRDGGGRGLGLLLEGHGASDLGVTAEDSHCISQSVSQSVRQGVAVIGQKWPPRCANVLTQGPCRRSWMINVPALTILMLFKRGFLEGINIRSCRQDD